MYGYPFLFLGAPLTFRTALEPPLQRHVDLFVQHLLKGSSQTHGQLSFIIRSNRPTPQHVVQLMMITLYGKLKSGVARSRSSTGLYTRRAPLRRPVAPAPCVCGPRPHRRAGRIRPGGAPSRAVRRAGARCTAGTPCGRQCASARSCRVGAAAPSAAAWAVRAGPEGCMSY